MLPLCGRGVLDTIDFEWLGGKRKKEKKFVALECYKGGKKALLLLSNSEHQMSKRFGGRLHLDFNIVTESI